MPDRPKAIRDDALVVLKRLRDAGHVAYFAGGCVRDLLLGQAPKDYDVATDAPPQKVRELFSNSQAVGAAFGVILVRYRKSQIEVATFRAEGAYEDGRHPSSVRFTTAQEDAKRRDFTINGLFLDPISDQVIDYVGGRDDLQNRLVRAIGEPKTRFDEDSLRLLRAVRFASRLGFQIESATAAAIIEHSDQLKRISPERIAEELRLILTPRTRASGWKMLWELKLIHTIFRFLKIERQPQRRGGTMLMENLANGRSIPSGLALAAAVICYRLQVEREVSDPRSLFAFQVVRAQVKSMRQALKTSNEESEQMQAILQSMEPLLGDAMPSLAILKRFLAAPYADESRLMMDALASAGIQTQRIQNLRAQMIELQKADYAPAPLIDGNILTELGLLPGPIFKRILNEVYNAQLEGRVATVDEARNLALDVARAASS